MVWKSKIDQISNRSMRLLAQIFLIGSQVFKKSETNSVASDQPVANIPLVTSQLRQRVAPQSNLQQSNLPISEKLCTTIGPPRHLEEYRTISSVPVSLRLNRENPDSLEFSYLAQNEHHAPPNPMLHRTLRASASPKLFKAAPYLNHNDNR